MSDVIAAWISLGVLLFGVVLMLPWAFGDNRTWPWRAAGFGMLSLAAGFVGIVVTGFAT